ncbi:hypothetical protein DFJ43DRAFT_1085317 [Lentinula guzmanii]|uniref:F-box domain-containing protein n=1 Tax=Lentinula guzmanii TaxID=2804957 RepID=A0AA38MZ20_9AGAR|nr:hypothetical protein DFJ43DRAFT_1085317 [Lentinula guzmanii]
MAQLPDLPVEILSCICDNTEFASLFSLARTCRVFNQLAERRFLQLTKFDVQTRHLNIVSEQELQLSDSKDAFSFNSARRLCAFFGTLLNIESLTCTFPLSSSLATIRQMAYLVQILRTISAQQGPRDSCPFSIVLEFDGDPGPSVKAQHESRFGQVFRSLLCEIRRLRCDSLELRDRLPAFRNAVSLELPIDDALERISIGGSWLFSWSRPWLIELLNSSSKLSSINAKCSKIWTEILPKLCLPALECISFYWYLDDTEASNVKVFVDFAKRHPCLGTLDCGEQFVVTWASSRCTELLSNISTLRGTISQLRYFLSSPDTSLRKLEDIEIRGKSAPARYRNYHSWEPYNKKYPLWELFALISTRPSIVKVILPMDLAGFQKQLFPEFKQGRLSITTRSTLPRIRYLVFKRSLTLYVESIADFVDWACQVFPSAERLEMLDSDRTLGRPLVQCVKGQWPSIHHLVMDDHVYAVQDQNNDND